MAFDFVAVIQRDAFDLGCRAPRLSLDAISARPFGVLGAEGNDRVGEGRRAWRAPQKD
jgi:hypothetical protein